MRDVAPPAGVAVVERTVVVDDEAWTLRQLGAARMGGVARANVLSVEIVSPAGGSGSREPAATRYLVASSLGEAAEDQVVGLVREAMRD